MNRCQVELATLSQKVGNSVTEYIITHTIIKRKTLESETNNKQYHNESLGTLSNELLGGLKLALWDLNPRSQLP